MSEKIHFRDQFTIEKDNVEEFKKRIKEMSEYVEANEPDTLEYQFYLNHEETYCMVHETYRDSEAALFHNKSTASKTILPRIFNIAELNRFDVYGNPNEELRNILKALNSQTFTLFTGINRLSK
jgi:quinol monooxygenase YgiN